MFLKKLKDLFKKNKYNNYENNISNIIIEEPPL